MVLSTPKYEIHKTLCVSTGHLPREEADKLTARGLEVTQDSYGYELYCSPDDEFGNDYHPNVSALMKLAKEQECDYVRFDSDGPVLEGFEVFEW